jgi:hypothetical protein
MDTEIKPLGGFPPIFECSKTELQLIEQSKNREFAKITSAISIKDIMLKRSKLQ